MSFDSPYSDKCSMCSYLENKISYEKEKAKKDSFKFHLKFHENRTDAFYTKLRLEIENAITLSYDCQKNLAMPKIPDQAEYYARQLFLYNCIIFQGSSLSHRTHIML